ncbi:hypothetical protein C8R43DRAFT_878134, partial [Mycena crocata]
IVPTEELTWKDCYVDNQCARLKVPLDYSNSDGVFAAIAMIRVHSVVPHDSPEYRGPILINPGGPGGSGVDTILWEGPELATIVGPEFDVVGFDPRGECWLRGNPSDTLFQALAARFILAAREIWSSGGDDNKVIPFLGVAMLEGQLAGERDNGTLPFIHTDYTARDMLRIVRAKAAVLCVNP